VVSLCKEFTWLGGKSESYEVKSFNFGEEQLRGIALVSIAFRWRQARNKE